MSREVTIRLPAATGGRGRGRRVGARVAPGASAATSAPPPEKVPIGTGPKPTNAERDQLVAWIAAGLPQ